MIKLDTLKNRIKIILQRIQDTGANDLDLISVAKHLEARLNEIKQQ